ncbi:MAG: metal ABC transporter substrate-binding protein [Dehalococcoidia bacterium]
MKRIQPTAFKGLIAMVALAALSVAACGDSSKAPEFKDGDRLRVVATVAAVEAVAEAVGGDLIDLSVLAGAGVDVHDFELSPADRRRIDEAHVVAQVGLGLDVFVEKAAAKEQLVVLGEGLPVVRGAEEHDEGEDEHDDHGDQDPHVWHDVDNTKEMALRLARAFGQIDTANAATYLANAEALGARLDAADAEIKALIDQIPEENRKVVTNHDAIGYFLDRYGLVFVGAVIPAQTTAAEPSAKDLVELSDLIRAEGVKAIFAESSVDPKVAAQLAKDTGVTIVEGLYADSLGPPGSGADTIEGMLLANAKKIAEALR